MSHDTSPKQFPTSQAAADPFDSKRRPTLSREKRTQINRELDLPANGLAVAVNYPPGRRQPHLTIVRLPRGSAGQAPRGGVHIPQPVWANRVHRASKHARQQHRDGMFGNQGKATIERKLAMLNASRTEALRFAFQRRMERAAKRWAQMAKRFVATPAARSLKRFRDAVLGEVRA